MTQPPVTPGYQSVPPQGSGGMSTAAFVLGIVALCASIVLFCVPFIGGLLGIVAIILGGIAMSQSTGQAASRARTGLILGVIAVVIAVGIWIAARAGLSFLQKKSGQLQQQMQEQLDKAKAEQEKANQQNQTNPTTGPGSAAPTCVPWRLASSVRPTAGPGRTMYVVFPPLA